MSPVWVQGGPGVLLASPLRSVPASRGPDAPPTPAPGPLLVWFPPFLLRLQPCKVCFPQGALSLSTALCPHHGGSAPLTLGGHCAASVVVCSPSWPSDGSPCPAAVRDRTLPPVGACSRPPSLRAWGSRPACGLRTPCFLVPLQWSTPGCSPSQTPTLAAPPCCLLCAVTTPRPPPV